MPGAARSLREPDSFPGPKDLERIEVRCLPGYASLKFSLQFVGAVHPQIGIVHKEAVIRSERDRAVDGFDPLLKKGIVVVDMPPALSVVGVGDVELCARVAVCRIGALEGEARFLERI